jgi:hypothetical protein
MIKRIVLPGSEGEEEAAGAAGSSGRFTADDLGALNELIRWWRHRASRGDSADPLESHYGGVDADGTARTTGLVPATVAFGRPLLPQSAMFDGAALLVMALGAPDPPVVGEVYSLAALCHFYRAESDWLSRYATLGRAPAGATTTEIRAAVDLAGPSPILQVVGVAGLTIDWKMEVYRLEIA